MPIRAELHCHSNYSQDCNVPLENIIQQCGNLGISLIALTDHNTMAGAQKLQAIAPEWLSVIVGEEITTQQGDLIGLFLKEEIAPGKDIHSTILNIRDQGGIVLLPHPLDRIRKEAVGLPVLESIKGEIDYVELYNSRCLFSQDNQAAAEYAKNQGIAGFVGSDAHLISEYGNALCILDTDNLGLLTRDTFREYLNTAHFACRPAGPWVHFQTKWVKWQKRKQAPPALLPLD